MNTLSGFGNHFSSESLKGALTLSQNSPQRVPYGLYAEQLSGSAFTRERKNNLRSWLYRIRPSVGHDEFYPLAHHTLESTPFNKANTPPTQLRFDPMPYAEHNLDFIDSLFTLAGNGCVEMQAGAAIHLYAAKKSMHDTYFYNADGDFLIVPQEGQLKLLTEFGQFEIHPGECAVIPRGIKYQVHLLSECARGYICENFGLPFCLPELGVIGANGLAHPRDFLTPTAHYEEKSGQLTLIAKFQGKLWRAAIDHSPLDVVAWHGNYVPYKYDLSLFNTINTVSFDHPDPSIFTVLTSPSTTPGVANLDFVIFPPRWMVAAHTFRPPYFHRNIMSEFMGLIHGKYDAKETGFVPGGCSLHNSFSAHGPDNEAYQKGKDADLKPEYYDNTLAFMFESKQVFHLTTQAMNASFRQKNYLECWKGYSSHFNDNITA